MKKILLTIAVLALVGCGQKSEAPQVAKVKKAPNEDGCVIDTVSKMVTVQKASEVTNLVKIKSPKQCRVRYNISINGEWHDVDWTTTGYFQEEELCNIAIRDGRNQLMVQLGGEYQTEQTVECTRKESGT